MSRALMCQRHPRPSPDGYSSSAALRLLRSRKGSPTRADCHGRDSRHGASVEDAMRLSDKQLRRLDEDGCLDIPHVFSADEIVILRTQNPALFTEQRPVSTITNGS